MARIVMNGSLKIFPERPPAVVQAHRDLAKIHRQLIDYKAKLDESHLELQIMPLIEDACRIQNDYLAVLSDCERALKSSMFSLPQGSRAYYEPVLTFVSLANNSHTVLPFIDYLDYALCKAEWRQTFKKEPSYWPFHSMEGLQAFLSERVEDSVQTCRSYLALLSNSLDSFVEGTDINGMLGRIFAVQKTVALYKSGSRKLHAFLDSQIQKSEIILGKVENPENVGPILFFQLQQLVSNAFKASLVAGSSQKENALSLDKNYYPAIAEISDPRVKVSTRAAANGKALVTIEDNGIGIPRHLLRQIFTTPNSGVFYQFIVSNGSSMRIIPFTADLTGTEIEVKSEPGKGTRFDIAIPSLN